MTARDRLLHHDRKSDGLLISSPQGHSGKTLVSIGLCDIFRRRGLVVQPFKKGPDYIDPSWLSVASGRACRNLDLFIIPEERLLRSFHRSMEGANLCVVEGAMGLFDGFESPESGTTAEIARLFDLPIILVVNASRMTGSIAAMVGGYQHFQSDIRIAGVILNQVSGSRHEMKLKAAVETYCRIPVVGSIPRDLDLKMGERHLGLTPSYEMERAESIVEQIGRKLETCLDSERLLAISKSADKNLPTKTRREKKIESVNEDKVKIGVFYDRVFHFYYPENLEALKAEGAELVLIDSLKDRLPEVDGLYIGGGFPELFLKPLEENRSLRQEIKEAVEKGLPVYAECAGLMYLCQSLDGEDRSYEMAGILPARVKMSKKPQGHGYVVAEVTKENPFFPTGLTVRGHEFHHSSFIPVENVDYAYRIKRALGSGETVDGIVYKNLFASYVHLHALGTPEWAPAFVSLVSKWASKEKKMNSRSKRTISLKTFPLYS
jgi:cobyrinic acid a,c-diamide synthase